MKRALMGVAGFCVIGAATLRAWSQEADSFRLLRDALVSLITGYVVLPTEFICADGQNRIYASPDGTDALIVYSRTSGAQPLDKVLKDKPEREQDVLARGGSSTIQVLLFSQGDDHAQVVWRASSNLASGLTTPRQVVWFSATRTALLHLTLQPDPLLANHFHDDRPDDQSKKKLPPKRKRLFASTRQPENIR